MIFVDVYPVALENSNKSNVELFFVAVDELQILHTKNALLYTDFKYALLLSLFPHETSRFQVYMFQFNHAMIVRLRAIKLILSSMFSQLKNGFGHFFFVAEIP